MRFDVKFLVNDKSFDTNFEGTSQEFDANFGETYAGAYETGKQAGYNSGYNSGYNDGNAVGIEIGKKAERNAFWDRFQNNGALTNYASPTGMFNGTYFSFDNFYPTNDIKPTGTATHLFYNWGTYGSNDKGHTGDFAKRLQECGVILDTSKATNLTSAFNYNRADNLPTIDCTGLTAACTYVFANSHGSRTTIQKIITKESVTYANWFASASGLKNITFEGVIGQNIDFTACTSLTVASMNSIISCLKDYSGTGTTHTLSLGSTNLAKLTDAEKAVATQKGWTLA